MKAYSMDLRQRVIAACDRDESTKLVAQKFNVSPAWVRRLKQHRRERGDIIPRKGGGSRGVKINRDRLRQLIDQQPDATLAELRERLGVSVTLWSICRALKQLKYSYKKSRSTPPNKTVPMSPSVVSPGDSSRQVLIHARSFSSTKPGPRPT
jgi:transposase